MNELDELIKDLSVCDDAESCATCKYQTDYEGCAIEWSDCVHAVLKYLKEYKEKQA